MLTLMPTFSKSLTTVWRCRGTGPNTSTTESSIVSRLAAREQAEAFGVLLVQPDPSSILVASSGLYSVYL